MNIYSEYYASHPLLQVPGHLEHCLSHVRQSLMCAGDMSMNVYQWSKNHNRAILITDVAHTCRNFDKLQEWERDHWYPEFDDTKLTTYMDDGLGIE
jgi:hypothetical protein